MDAFRDLGTCRQLGMATGPIPWLAVMEYGDRHELTRDNTQALAVIIRAMDARYLDYVSDKGG